MGGVGGLGGGAFVMWENFTCWDPHDKESVEGTFEFFEVCDQLAKKMNLGVGMERLNALCRGSDGKEVPKERREIANAVSPIAHALRYQQKIREAFNPNDLGDAYYVTLEP